jgi:trimethylamine--corrinoid protein Co-methyltransferase
MKPLLKFLDDDLIRKIVSEAHIILETLGVEIHNEKLLSVLAGRGIRVDFDKKRAFMNNDQIDSTLKTTPHSFKLYDAPGSATHDFAIGNSYFTPGSAALYILDHESGKTRRPVTEDYIRYAKLVSRLSNIASQSTAFIPADVHEGISDSYRLFLSLLFCEKPVITGAFTVESFAVMKDMQVAVRGSEKALAERPLTIFSCCPTSPLKWSMVTSQNLADCAQYMIPAELISMPLSGFMAPVSLVGTLIQHTAETLSGIAISQLVRPGAPVLYGGSPAIFDVRYETTPMGAIETQMIDCAYNEIGRFLGLPTQAYISLSDAKQLDAQAGLESGIGAALAVLSGINNISGPGMLDFESCQSLEKLVIDNETCGMALRLAKGIEPRGDFPGLPLFEELLRDKHLLISKHTRKFLRLEHYMPGEVIDRANRARWLEQGGITLNERAHVEVERLINKYEPSRLPDKTKAELVKLMEHEANKFGMSALPERK